MQDAKTSAKTRTKTAPKGNASQKQKKPVKARKPIAKKAEKAREAQTPPSTSKPTRKQQLLDLLNRQEGATISDMCEAFDWQPHSARAALTGLRKAGHSLIKVQDDKSCTYFAGPTEGPPQTGKRQSAGQDV